MQEVVIRLQKVCINCHATITSGLRLGRAEVLMSLKYYQWAQSQGHHTVDHLEGGVERGSARRFSLKGRGRERAIVNRTNIGLVLKATFGKILRRCGAHFFLIYFFVFFRAHRYHLELNWTEMIWAELNWTNLNDFGVLLRCRHPLICTQHYLDHFSLLIRIQLQ